MNLISRYSIVLNPHSISMGVTREKEKNSVDKVSTVSFNFIVACWGDGPHIATVGVLYRDTS